MKNALYVILILGMLSSCSNEQPEVSPPITLEQLEMIESEVQSEHELSSVEIDFADFYSVFSATIESRNYEMFNGFIHPDNGCYAIESSGAMPVFTSVYDVGEFISKLKAKRFFDLPFVEIDHMVSFESLPNITCEAQIYDKVGCFANSSEEFKTSEIWNYAGLSEDLVVEVGSLADKVNITVVNTSNYNYHFSKIEERWYISFVDFRVLCAV